MFSGAAGSDAVSGIFNLLGIALIVAGLGLAGYAYLLRQQEMSGVPADDQPGSAQAAVALVIRATGGHARDEAIPTAT
jgi:hypothetical protein